MLTRTFIYRDSQNFELNIPALYFPVKDVLKDQNFYRKGIVIPLIKEVLADREAVGGPGTPVVLPMDLK